MAIDDTNVYQRNLKMISGAFIAYWLLGLEVTTNPHLGAASMNLMFVHVTIKHTQLMPLVAWTLLLYSFWRYWINANVSGFWGTTRQQVHYGIPTDARKSRSMMNKLIKIAVQEGGSRYDWIPEGILNTLDQYKLMFNSSSFSQRGKKEVVRCSLVGINEKHTQGQNEVLFHISFRKLPFYYLRKLLFVMAKKDITHTTIIPIMLFVLAIIAGVLTHFNFHVF